MFLIKVQEIFMRLRKKKQRNSPIRAKRMLRLNNYRGKLEIIHVKSEFIILINQMITFVETEFPNSMKFRKIRDMLKSQIKDENDLCNPLQITKYHLYSILTEIFLSINEEEYFQLNVEFHPIINRTSLSLYLDKHYGEAVFAAVKELNIYVKKLANIYDKDLWEAMAKAFNEENPILKLNKLESRSDINEQEGFKFLFMGAMKGIRNPLGHDNYDIGRNTALYYLSFLSLLFNKAENAII